jgi:hypothetical protein
MQPGGSTVAGFHNLDTAFQYQLYKDGAHELAVMVGLIVEWGGATNSGLAASFSTLSPAIYLGKGFGDLPDQLSWVRPFVVTGQFSYNIPTSSLDLVAAVPIPQTVSYKRIAAIQHAVSQIWRH